MKIPIFTISRQFGSGGRTVGKRLAERLAIPCYDQELIEKIMEESGFTREFVERSGEQMRYSSWIVGALSDRDINGHSIQDDLWSAQFSVITQLAQQGPCVIVGRCGDYILRERKDCLRIFIHADMAHRIQRIVQQYGQRQDAPEKRLRDKDQRREAYYQFYTGQKWGEVKNYHLTLDSGKLGIDRCVQVILSALG